MTDEAKNQGSSITQDSSVKRYLHLVYFALFYGCLQSLAAGSLVQSVGIGSFVPEAIWFSTMASTALIVAFWSAFGQGSYLTRLVWSHLCGGIVLVGWLVGFAVGSSFDLGFDSNSLIELLLVVSAIPAISLGTQIPFLVFRVFFGWQLVYGKESLSRAYELRDVFTITFLIAAAIGLPQFATHLARNDGVFFSNQQTEEPLTTSDPTAASPSVYAEQMSPSQENHLQELIGYAIAATLSLVLTAFCLPMFLIVFSERNLHVFILCAFYCSAPAVFLMFLGVVYQAPADFHFAVISICWGLGAAIYFPLAVSRICGFRLTAPRTESRKIFKEQKTTSRKPDTKTGDKVPIHPTDSFRSVDE